MMTIKWYTYHSHPHKEEMLFHQIQCHDLDGFYPSLTVIPKNPRCRTVRPYFPGYLFVYVDLDTINFSTLQYMPYSCGLVEFGGEPAVVPDDLILSIKKRVAKIDTEAILKEEKQFISGEQLVISSGPLEGYEALFDQSISGHERSRILIKTLYNHTLRVEISNKMLEKK